VERRLAWTGLLTSGRVTRRVKDSRPGSVGIRKWSGWSQGTARPGWGGRGGSQGTVGQEESVDRSRNDKDRKDESCWGGPVGEIPARRVVRGGKQWGKLTGPVTRNDTTRAGAVQVDQVSMVTGDDRTCSGGDEVGRVTSTRTLGLARPDQVQEGFWIPSVQPSLPLGQRLGEPPQKHCDGCGGCRLLLPLGGRLLKLLPGHFR